VKRVYHRLFPLNQGKRGTLGAWGRVFVPNLQGRGLGPINIVWEKQREIDVLTAEYFVLDHLVQRTVETKGSRHIRQAWAWRSWLGDTPQRNIPVVKGKHRFANGGRRGLLDHGHLSWRKHYVFWLLVLNIFRLRTQHFFYGQPSY